MMPVLFSYVGWQNGTYIAGELRRPQRDVPWAVIGGTLVVIAAYIGINAAYLRVLTPEAIAADRLFAVEVARSCAERAFCHELATSFPGVPLDEDLFFVFRAYVAPGNTVSPAHDEILTERVLHVGG